MKCEIWFDGASRGNPGPSGAGAVLSYEGGEEQMQRALGRKTCNEAEYEALILGLESALERGATQVHVYGDSMLVVRQSSGSWKCRAANLRGYCNRVRALCAEFERSPRFQWIPREKNAIADALANEALDGPPRLTGKACPHCGGPL